MNEYVLKIGGSLLNYPEKLTELCKLIHELSSKFRFVVVPGGGVLADTVRLISKKYELDDEVWHLIATLTLNQSAILISKLIEESCLASEFNECRLLLNEGKIVVFEPFKVVSQSTELPRSWKVTSDSIAAYIAAKLGIKLMVKLTDVDGVFDENPEEFSEPRLMKEIKASELKRVGESCLDEYISEILIKHGVKCYVINGLIPERLRILLSKGDLIGTLITPA